MPSVGVFLRDPSPYLSEFRKKKTTEYSERLGRQARSGENKRNNKQSIGKQHANNQSEEDKSHKVGKGEKEEETGREKIAN